MDKNPPRGLLPYDKEHTVTAIFDMLYHSVKAQSAEAAALLTFIAMLGPWHIPVSLMKQFQLDQRVVCDRTDEDTEALKRTLSDSTILPLALDRLAEVCLVKRKYNNTRSCETFSLHRAICQWCLEVVVSEKQDWLVWAAHGLAAGILSSNGRCVNVPRATLVGTCLYNFYCFNIT